jgi:hypothetical protein
MLGMMAWYLEVPGVKAEKRRRIAGPAITDVRRLLDAPCVTAPESVRTSSPRDPRSGTPSLLWQSEVERRADANLALGPDSPPMRLDDPLGDVEPEPQPHVV